MVNLKELQDNIEAARELLVNTIRVKGSLLDPEIVYISEVLDNLLNEYNRLNKSTKTKIGSVSKNK